MIEKYGAQWDLDDEIELDLKCYLFPEWRKVSKRSEWEHLRAAMQLFYGDKITWHVGMDQLGQAWCENRRLAVAGATRITKSYFFGALAVVDWLAAPAETKWFVYSTGLSELKQRVFESVQTHWTIIERDFPDTWGSLGKIKQVPLGLHLIDQSKNTGILGIPIEPGEDQESLNKKIGAHAPRMRLGGDEVQGVSPVCLKMEENLGGAQDFHEAVWGNFEDPNDALGMAMRPADNFDKWRKALTDNEIDYSATPEPEEWKSTSGFHSMWFDGLRTPSVLHPEGPEAGQKAYPFMLGKKRIDEIIANSGIGSFGWYKLVRSGPMPQGSTARVLSNEQQTQFGIADPPIWRGRYSECAGLDASRGVDDTCLVFLRWGLDAEGHMIVAFGGKETLKIDRTGEDIDMQITRQVIRHMEGRGLGKSDLAAESGAQLDSLIDTIERTWDSDDGRIVRINPTSNVPEIKVHAGTDKTCRDHYKTMTDFLWMQHFEFARYRQLRGFYDAKISEELDMRKVYPKSDPIHLQEKQHSNRTKKSGKMRDLKSELGRSPDATDASSVAFGMLRLKHGIVPGANAPIGTNRGKKGGSWAAKAAKINGKSRIQFGTPRPRRAEFFPEN